MNLELLGIGKGFVFIPLLSPEFHIFFSSPVLINLSTSFLRVSLCIYGIGNGFA